MARSILVILLLTTFATSALAGDPKLATVHIKQAEAYVKANAWANAGQEYTAATEIDGDPTHLLAAAEAFHKQPDDVRSRDALLAYLDKVPVGDKSDQIRVQVADLTRAIDKA